MKTLVPIEDLEIEKRAWGERMARAAERWVAARAAGMDTSELDEEQRLCERNWRRLERRIRKRKAAR